MTSSQLKYICTAVALFTVFCDQWTKHAMAMLRVRGTIETHPFLSLSYSENTGAAWSIFQGHPYLLAAIGIGAMVAIVLYKKHFSTVMQKILAAMIFGGILGNTIDRIFRGYVIDFIVLDLQFYRWPTFNLADFVICLGTLIFLFTFQKKFQKKC